MPQILVIQERPEKQQVCCQLVLLPDRLIGNDPRCPHAAIGVVLQWRIVFVLHRHQLVPLLVVEAKVGLNAYSALLQVRTRLCNR
jgi:hypothetical protein